jgi:hypothetical protein
MDGSDHHMVSIYSSFDSAPPIEPPLSDATPTSSVARPTNLDALALLQASDAAMNQLASLRETQMISDDAGNSLRVVFEYAAPDRLRFTLSNGRESVAVGKTQYYYEPGEGWREQSRAFDFVFPNFYLAKNAYAVKNEGIDPLNGDKAQVVSFLYDTAEGTFLYRRWIDPNTKRARRETMDGPGHHMVSEYGQYDAVIPIAVPVDGRQSLAAPAASLP